MKKLILFVGLLIAFAQFGVAQTAPAKKDAKTAQTAPKKKDGTPDMRYKANKNAAKDTTKHMKKNGTPDKRYKENKKKS